MDPHKFDGKDIPHIKLDPKMNIEDLVDVFANSGFNGRQLGEAAKLYAKMIEEDATICLTISGAMTPVGFGGIIKTLIERGFVDWIVTTGANVYHEDHFALGLPVKQGSFEVDDMKLYEKEIVRIRDVFIKFEETLEAEDQIIQKMFADDFQNKSFTTAEFCNLLGKRSKERSKYPEKSFITSAYDYDVPVYISTMKDSSLALNLAVHRLENKKFDLDLQKLFDVAKLGSGNSAALNRVFDNLLKGDFTGFKFTASNSVKDLTYIQDLLKDFPEAEKVAEVNKNYFQKAVDDGYGENFISELIDKK